MIILKMVILIRVLPHFIVRRRSLAFQTLILLHGIDFLSHPFLT